LSETSIADGAAKEHTDAFGFGLRDKLRDRLSELVRSAHFHIYHSETRVLKAYLIYNTYKTSDKRNF